MIQDRFSMPRLDVVGVNLTTTVVRPSQDFYAHLQSVFAEVSGRHPPRTVAWVKRKWAHYDDVFSGSLGSDWVNNLTILSMLPKVYLRRFQEVFHPQTLAAAREVNTRLVFNPDHHKIIDSTRKMLNELRAHASFRLVAMAYYAEAADVVRMLEAFPELTRWFERIYVLRDDGHDVAAGSDIIVPCSHEVKRRRLVSGGEIDKMFEHLGTTAKRYLHVGSHWQTDVLFGRNAGARCLLLDHELRYLGSRGGWRRCGRSLLYGRIGSTMKTGRLIVVNNHADAASIILNTAKAGTKRK